MSQQTLSGGRGTCDAPKRSAAVTVWPVSLSEWLSGLPKRFDRRDYHLGCFCGPAETGLASYYGEEATGEMTCAHRTGHSAAWLRFRAPVTPYVAGLTIAGRSFCGRLSMSQSAQRGHWG
jgi:hypothetical protein